MLTLLVHCQGCNNKVIKYIRYDTFPVVVTFAEYLHSRCPHCKQVGLFWLRIEGGVVTEENDPLAAQMLDLEAQALAKRAQAIADKASQTLKNHEQNKG